MKAEDPEIQWPSKSRGEAVAAGFWTKPRSRRGAFLLVAGYIALIFFLSSRPRLSPPTDIPHADKVVHAVEYGILGWLFAGGVDPRRKLHPGWVLGGTVLAALCIGALDELNQSRVPGRDSSAADLAADVIGAATAAFLWLKTRDALAEDNES